METGTQRLVREVGSAKVRVRGTQQNKREYRKSVSATQQGNAYMRCRHRIRVERYKMQ